MAVKRNEIGKGKETINKSILFHFQPFNQWNPELKADSWGFREIHSINKTIKNEINHKSNIRFQ